MQIYDITVDYTAAAVGIDSEQPVFSWKLKADENGVFQSGYRIAVYDGDKCSGKMCWDSGAVKSRNSFCVKYEGSALKPDKKYYFEITVTAGEETVSSGLCSFSTALLNGKMPAEWISIAEETDAAPLVRKKFNVSDVKRATLYLFSYGWYELYVNGKRFGREMFLSNYSGYGKVLFYDDFDITESITDGDNCIGLIIGDGYNKKLNRFMEHWEGKKRFTGFISVEKNDGETVRFCTDESWKYTLYSPIISNSIYNGEVYDARRETDGWSKADFNDGEWQNCQYTSDEEKVFRHIPGVKTEIFEEFKPLMTYKTSDGRYIFDFGQNMAGFVKISARGKAGEAVTVEHAEELKFDGNEPALDNFTNRNAKATDKYIFRGSDIETYTPHFTYHGFRYAMISGLETETSIDSVTACAVHTEFADAAEFVTDNDMINRLYGNALWSVKSNNIVYSSDCAARDERTPCAMDLFAYHDAAVHFADLHNYFVRWLYAAYNERQSEIKYPSWDGQIIAMTKLLYMHYGDKKIIEEMRKHNTERMEQYIAQWPDAKPKSDKEVLFGDWCIPNVPGEYETSADSRYEVEVAALGLCAECMADTESALGNEKEAAYYRNYGAVARKAYNELFFDSASCIYSSGKQTPNILALSDNIVDGSYKSRVADNLIRNIEENGSKLDVGIFGTRHFIECLSDAGNIDLAFKCFFGNEFPSFKYQFDKGATTLWEQWYESGNMASHNHAMFAGAVTGYFTRLAGITPLKPGFAEIRVKPVFSKRLNMLKSEIPTPVGRVKVAWRRAAGKIKLDIYIPANASAVVVLPGRPEENITNGKFTFEFKETDENGKNNRTGIKEHSVAG